MMSAKELLDACGAMLRLPRGEEENYIKIDPDDLAELIAAARESAKLAEEVSRLENEAENDAKIINDQQVWLGQQKARAEAAEARVRELEKFERQARDIAAERERGYAAREHGGIVNGKAADRIVSLCRDIPDNWCPTCRGSGEMWVDGSAPPFVRCAACGGNGAKGGVRA